MAAGASAARASLCWAEAGVGERLPADWRVGARHLLSCRRRCGSWRRRIHPDLLRGVPGLGRFAVGTQTAFLFFIFLWGGGIRAGQPSSNAAGVGVGARTVTSTWVGAARGHRGQQLISISPPGRRDLARARGLRGEGEGQTERALPALSSCHPRTVSPSAAGNRPSPSLLAPLCSPCSQVPARVPAPGAESPWAGGASGAAGGLRRAPPARGSVATGAALAAIFCSCRGRGSAE